MSSGAIDSFFSAASPTGTRILRLPAIILLFGGRLGDPKASSRQMFINWLLVKGHALSPLVRTPEQYSDWDKFEGYHNLIDFERDAGGLARAIVLFSESEGSYAELGAFCMDSLLAERLFVVIDRPNYSATSFIANGPIKKIELEHENSICVVDSMDPISIEPEFIYVAEALAEKISGVPKKSAFDPARQRDQFLLAADLVELFGAVTHHELLQLLKHMGADVTRARLDQLVNQLIRFELIELVEKMTKRYLVPAVERYSYLDYVAPKDAPPFDRTRFKMKHALPWLTKDKLRHQAYLQIHSRA